MIFRNSLKIRIAVVIFILELGMVTLILRETLTISMTASQEQLAANEEIILNLLSDLSRPALLTEEYGELQAYIEQVIDDPHTVEILVTNADGMVVVSTVPSDIGSLFHSLEDGVDLFWQTREISNVSGKLGVVAIQFSNQGLVQATRQARNAGLRIAITGMIVIAVVGLFFGFLLTRRLEQLAAIAQRFAAGELGVRANLSGDDEVALVGRAFDTAVNQIEQYIASLQESEARYRNIFQTINIAIWEEDFSAVKVAIDEIKAGGVKEFRDYLDNHPEFVEQAIELVKIIDVNEEVLKIYGAQNKEELLGSLSQTFIPESLSFFREELIAIAEGESVFEAEAVTQTLQGKPVDILLKMSIPDDKNAFDNILVSMIDITKRKQAEKERTQIEVHLRQQQKLESIGTLASGVAHEINNPITGIMNYAQLINDRLDPQSPLREFASEIGHETERVAQIVRNLLTFARQDKQSHSPARIADILNGTLSLIRTIIHRDQIILKVDIPDDLPKIKCRSQQIQQIFMNLFTNARDALNERYPEYNPNKIIIITVRPFKHEGRRWLRTTVEDYGTGIPVEIRNQLFDPFYTTKDRTKGTGLGLSISRGIAQDHHGKLFFESEQNQYTRFYLDLPVDNGWSLDEVSKE